MIDRRLSFASASTSCTRPLTRRVCLLMVGSGGVRLQPDHQCVSAYITMLIPTAYPSGENW